MHNEPVSSCDQPDAAAVVWSGGCRVLTQALRAAFAYATAALSPTMDIANAILFTVRWAAAAAEALQACSMAGQQCRMLAVGAGAHCAAVRLGLPAALE